MHNHVNKLSIFLDEENIPFCYVSVGSDTAKNNGIEFYELAFYDCQTPQRNCLFQKPLETRLERESEIAKITKGKIPLMLLDIHKFNSSDDCLK